VRLDPQDAADSARGIVELSARIYVPSTNANLVDLYAFDNPPNDFSRRGFHVSFKPDGGVVYYRERQTPLPDLALETDAWQDVFIRADLDRRCFDLTVNGRTARDIPFAYDDVRRLRAIGIGPDSTRSILCIDSVKVRVIPNP